MLNCGSFIVHILLLGTSKVFTLSVLSANAHAFTSFCGHTTKCTQHQRPFFFNCSTAGDCGLDTTNKNIIAIEWSKQAKKILHFDTTKVKIFYIFNIFSIFFNYFISRKISLTNPKFHEIPQILGRVKALSLPLPLSPPTCITFTHTLTTTHSLTSEVHCHEYFIATDVTYMSTSFLGGRVHTGGERSDHRTSGCCSCILWTCAVSRVLRDKKR